MKIKLFQSLSVVVFFLIELNFKKIPLRSFDNAVDFCSFCDFRFKASNKVVSHDCKLSTKFFNRVLICSPKERSL